jgi:hypothetical protein
LASPDAVRKTLAAQNLRVDARAEQLSVLQFAALQASLAAAR